MPRQERTNANQPLGDVKRTPAPINNSPVNKNNQRFQPRVSETPNSANHSATNRNYQSRSPIDIHNWRGLAIQESFSSSQTSSERFNEYKNGRILDIIAERAKRGNINRIVFAENEQIERNELRRDQVHFALFFFYFDSLKPCEVLGTDTVSTTEYFRFLRLIFCTQTEIRAETFGPKRTVIPGGLLARDSV